MVDPKDPEKNKHIPSLEEVTDAYSSVVEHNERYASTAAAFRNTINTLIITSDILGDDLETAPAPETPEPSPVLEGDMDADLQELLHGDTFSRIGIRLYPIGGESLRMLDGKRATSTELEPMVANTELFVDFLRQQTKESMNGSENRLRLISGVLKTLEKFIRVAYTEGSKDSPDSEVLLQNGEDALRTFLAIDDQLQKLGLDEPAIYQEYLELPQSGYLDENWRKKRTAEEYSKTYHKLQNYIRFWGEDVLPEYIKIGEADEFSKGVEWAVDNQMELLTKKVDYIISLIGPERTTKFGLHCAEIALAGMELTLRDIDEDPNSWANLVNGVRPELKRNIKRLRTLL